jgi:prepilin-type N-terminal cleavage/methylation domain-containing protein
MQAKGQQGFTLIEMAIVLVIIGLILGAVLKGQELIGNAKVKKLQQQFINGLDGFIWGFYDRKGRFPGDCNNNGLIGYALPNGVAAPYAVPAVSTNQNPTAAGEYCQTTATAENQNVPFGDLRSQGFLSPNATNQELTRFTGFGTQTEVRIGTANARNAIVVYNIPSYAAQMIDASIDGAENATSGRLRAWDAATAGLGGAWQTNKDQLVHIVYYFDRQP